MAIRSLQPVIVVLTVACVGIAVFFLLGFGVRAIISPWSWPIPGRKTLTGSWYGDVHYQTGQSSGMFLKIHLPYRLRAGVNLSGTAQLCDKERGGIVYDVFGRTNGSNIQLYFSVTKNKQERPRFDYLQGEWLGNRLHFRGFAYPTAAASSLAGASIPAVVELQKGAEKEYQEVCAQLAQP